MTKAQEQFNEDYAFMRQMLLHGDFTVKAAKAWLVDRGAKAEKSAMCEWQEGMEKRMGRRVERDLDKLHEIEAEEKEEEELENE